MDSTLALVFPGGKRLQNNIAATLGDVVTNLSPAIDKRWLVLHGYLVLVADANASNRLLRLLLTDGTDITRIIGRADAITATQTRSVSFADHVSQIGGWNLADQAAPLEISNVGIGTVIIEGADQLRIQVVNGLAGDSYSGRVVVLEI